MSVPYVNMIIQGGIYYFELNKETKNRPFLVISKDNGYGKDVLAFIITERFTSNQVSLPIVLNNCISFIRVSGSKEVSMAKIFNSSFIGILTPKVFNIATRMYMKRFANVNDEDLKRDLESYLDELENGNYSFYLDRNKRFSKKEYLSNNLVLDDTKASNDSNNSSILITAKSDKEQDKKIFSEFTLKQLFTIKKMMREQSKKDIQKKYLIDNWKCDYICTHIERLITEKKRQERRR